MTLAYIGLGGNVGDVVANMSGALQAFDALPGSHVENVSGIYRTPPWGIEDQDWFYNACASLEVELQPFELLEECLKIERRFKRIREVRWGPRTLDLDILVFGDVEVATEELSIPHPRMHERAFVMKPLNDIAPELEVFGKRPGEWLLQLEDGEQMEEVAATPNWWQQ